jgi:probable LLM family oxidoreductase
MAAPLELGLDTFGDVGCDGDGNPLPHARMIRNVIEEAVVADEAGVDFFGVGEHHRPDFAVSAPEIVLAVIAGRTARIRLGSATTVLSTDDPVRVFQRFATLHAASGGRTEVILGRGWFTESFPLFGYDRSQYGALFDEKLDLFAALLRRNIVTWRGKLRPELTNQPVYPPIEAGPLRTWIAVGATPESVLRAARYDLPMILAVIGGEPQRFRPFVELYHRACEKLGRAPQQIGMHSVGYVAASDADAREEFWFDYKLQRDRIGAERGWPPLRRSVFDLEVDRGSLYVGSPETVASKIAGAMSALAVSRFQMKYSVGALPHEKLLRSIELYGAKVMPLVRDMIGG